MGTNTKFEKLIAGVHSEHNCKLYAIDTNNHFMKSTDALVWDTNGEVPANFPKNQLSYTAYPLVTNKFIDRMVPVSYTHLGWMAVYQFLFSFYLVRGGLK